MKVYDPEVPMLLPHETRIFVKDVPALVTPFPDGKKPSQSCVYGWISEGVKTLRGVVKLEALKIGGRVITSREAVERFLAAQVEGLEMATAG
jgi:hypothetical protein